MMAPSPVEKDSATISTSSTNGPTTNGNGQIITTHPPPRRGNSRARSLGSRDSPSGEKMRTSAAATVSSEPVGRSSLGNEGSAGGTSTTNASSRVVSANVVENDVSGNTNSAGNPGGGTTIPTTTSTGGQTASSSSSAGGQRLLPTSLPADNTESLSKAKWDKMVARGLHYFLTEQRETFLRRVRRGIPPQHRWTVWKAAVSEQKVGFFPGGIKLFVASEQYIGGCTCSSA